MHDTVPDACPVRPPITPSRFWRAVVSRALQLGFLAAVVPVVLTIGSAPHLPSGVNAAGGSYPALIDRDQSGPQPPVDTLQDVGEMVFQYTNRERENEDLPSLRRDSVLTEAACEHSRDMIRRSFFRHENPDGETPSDRVGKRHRRMIGESGENIVGQGGSELERGERLARQLVDQWMESPPHRENILRSKFTHVGVCVVQADKTIRATQVFARVRAYLKAPLPRTGVPGDSLVAPIDQTIPPGRPPAKYDFWNPQFERRAGTNPSTYADTLRLPSSEGTYRLRLYFPESGRFTIHTGPEIIVAE